MPAPMKTMTTPVTTPNAADQFPAGTAWLRATAVLSIVLSAGGIGWAALWDHAGDAGRGGALAVALSFAMLFLGRGTAESALEAQFTRDGRIVERGHEEETPSEQLALDVARVRNAVASMLDWQQREKLWLTVSSVTGTLAWGFGDICAQWLCGLIRH